MHSPQLRPPLPLAAVALAALAVALLLAFAAARAPRPDTNGDSARRTTAEIPIGIPAAQRPAVSTAADADAEHGHDAGRAGRNGPLWALLAPWALAVDAIAVLGLAVVLIVRYNARRRRRART